MSCFYFATVLHVKIGECKALRSTQAEHTDFSLREIELRAITNVKILLSRNGLTYLVCRTHGPIVHL